MQRINDKELRDGRRQVILEHEWRRDFVGEALTFELDAQSGIQMIEFYSARLGVVRWQAGRGLGNARQWETEAAAQDVGDWQRAFPSMMINGRVPRSQGEAIVATVMEHFRDTPIEECVRDAMRTPEEPLTWLDEWFPRSSRSARVTDPNCPEHRKDGGIIRIGRAVLDLMTPYAAWSRDEDSDDEES